jgi:hypothetical protein
MRHSFQLFDSPTTRAWIALGLVTLSGCHSTPLRPPRVDNGIVVDVKVYDTAALRARLAALSGQLSLVSGIDQTTLISRIGALQGAYSNQFSAALQATTLPTAQLQTQTQSSLPSTTSTNYTPTPGAVLPLASNLNAAQYNQQQVTNNGTTTANTLTNNSVAPAPAALPTAPTPVMPTSFSTSSLDALNEEMQLSYQIVNLQLVLQGAVSDDIDASGNERRHVTLGFPISVAARSDYPGKVAEVSVRVCSPRLQRVKPVDDGALAAAPPPDLVRQDGQSYLPKLQTLIPQEKTYNVAGLVSNSSSFGIGGIIAGIVNVGASVGSQHQTYYLVKQQDTVALPTFDTEDLSTYRCPLDTEAPNETQSVGFAWQFRPVLDHPAVDEGVRTTFAQISLPPLPKGFEATGPLGVVMQSCWRDYDSKKGVVGKVVAGSCSVSGELKPAPEVKVAEIPKQDRVCIPYRDKNLVWCYNKDIDVPFSYDTLNIRSVKGQDNLDNTITVSVTGTFPQSTRVAIGTAYLDPATIGFENSGESLRFTVNAQLLALYGARLLSADSKSRDIKLAAQSKVVTAVRKPSATVQEVLDSVGAPTAVQGPNDRAPKPRTELTANDLNMLFDLSSLKIFLKPPLPAAKPCTLPTSEVADKDITQATVRPFSDTDVRVDLELWRCLSNDEGSTGLPAVVILGGQIFGLSNAPLLEYDPTKKISFHAPRALVSSQNKLIVKPLLLDPGYSLPFALPVVPVVNTTTVESSTKQLTTYLLSGAYLDHLVLSLQARGAGVELRHSGSAYAELNVPTVALTTLKQVRLDGRNLVDGKIEDEVPRLGLTLPDGGSPKESVASSGASLYGVSLLDTGAQPEKKTPNPDDSDKTKKTEEATAPASYTITANDLGLASSLENAEVLTFTEGAPVHTLVACKQKDGKIRRASQSVGHAIVLWSNHDILVFGLTQPLAKSIKQVALVLSQQDKDLPTCEVQAAGGEHLPAEPRVYLLDLPKLPDPTADAKAKTFNPDGKTSIPQGSTGPLVIKGVALDQIATATYLGTELVVRITSDGSTATIDTVPATLSQKAGSVPIVIRLKDGSRSDVLVAVTSK